MKKHVQKRLWEIILAKTHYYSKEQWCGCYTVNEILMLFKKGAVKSHDDPHYCYEILLESKIGKTSSNWFYFYPKKALLKELEEKEREMKCHK